MKGLDVNENRRTEFHYEAKLQKTEWSSNQCGEDIIIHRDEHTHTHKLLKKVIFVFFFLRAKSILIASKKVQTLISHEVF